MALSGEGPASPRKATAMAISLELTPDLQQRLIEAAERNGALPTAFLSQLLEAQLPTARNGVEAPSTSHSSRKYGAFDTYQEWRKAIEEWIERQPRGRPVLSLDAMDRETIYD